MVAGPRPCRGKERVLTSLKRESGTGRTAMQYAEHHSLATGGERSQDDMLMCDEVHKKCVAFPVRTSHLELGARSSMQTSSNGYFAWFLGRTLEPRSIPLRARPESKRRLSSSTHRQPPRFLQCSILQQGICLGHGLDPCALHVPSSESPPFSTEHLRARLTLCPEAFHAPAMMGEV